MTFFNIKNCAFTLLTITVCLINFGCEKYLDQKPDDKLVVPASLSDLQALLDLYTKVNNSDPGAADESADEYYLSNSIWSSLRDEDRRTYVWEKDNLFTPSRNAWSDVYTNIYTANTIIETIGKMDQASGNQMERDNIKGQALFLRAKSFLMAAFIWTLAYDETTAASDLGLPLRLGTDFNETSARANNKQTYEQIVVDLKAAIPLLPISPLHVMRASKPAAYGLLARTYLAMRKYDMAKIYADSCLLLNSTLLDYNTIPSSGSFRIPQFSPEVIYHSQMAAPAPITTSYAKMDTSLFASFDVNDLRRELFFKQNTDGSYGFYGNYTHSGALFSGIAIDEIYLTRAECHARAGNKVEALEDLNTLLAKRWKAGTFVSYTALDANDALKKILTERKKELIFRGLRWMDIKRLNKEGANITLMRKLNNQLYTLPPNDLRFALPIPEDIIQLSGMQQNSR